MTGSIADLVVTITEIINTRLKEAHEARVADAALPQQNIQPIALERWVGKKEVAEHFKISIRTVDNWMIRRLLPYIRTGRNVRFKLSEADETVNRCIKIEGR